jgi:hypothetical protein
MLACTNCAHPIIYDPAGGRLPPWCPHCGADLKYGNAKPAVPAVNLPPEEPEEPQEPTAAPATATLATVPTPDRPAPTHGRLLKIGVLLLLVSGWLAFDAMKDADGSAQVQGTVVRLVPGSDGAQPEVAYTVAEHEYKTLGETSSYFARGHAVGDSVEVHYPPDRPNEGRVSRAADAWWWARLTAAVGFGLVVLWVLVRKRPAT